MRTRTLSILLLVLATRGVAQVSELGFTGGVMYYIGDINPTRHYPPHTHPAFGLQYRYNIDQRFALRIQGLYGNLEAYDTSSPDTLQQIRNLGFRTSIFEASFLMEINFFKYRGLTKDSKQWSPFVFFGMAYFHMNPQGKLGDTWYDLQPLGTEGQGTTAGGAPYSLDNISFPFGVGFKFALSEKLDLQLEWGLRKTNTDYIDDVSGRYVSNSTLNFETGPLTAELADPSIHRLDGINSGRARGDSQTNDWYQYTGLTLSFRLNRFTECDAIWDHMRNRSK